MMADNNHNIDKFDQIRNIGIIAHIDAGKTTLTERFLYYSGRTHRIGNVDSGNTVMDYLDEERERGITIVAAAATFPWQYKDQPYLIHLIDTPGHIDFTAEVERSIRVSDGAVVIFSGVEGVEAQSEKVWRQSDKYNVPKIAFVNKLDRLGASFPRVVEEIRFKFSKVKAVVLHLPIGIESDFKGVVDLLLMKALYFKDDGATVEIQEIPPDILADAENAREELLTTIADMSDEVAELYLDEKEIPLNLIHRAIRENVITGKLCPIFAGSAKKNIAVQTVLDAIILYLPSPEDRKIIHATAPKTGDELNIDINNDNFSGLVFKIVASTNADLLYLRTYSGKLAVNDTIFNPRLKEKIRIKRLLRLYSKNVESIEEVGAGDIVGIIGPQDVVTGDTFCAVNRPVILEQISFPEPVISVAIEPKSSKDKERLTTCLQLLCREDPTLHLKRDESTGQQILSGMGELHLEINCNRIEQEFKLQARYGAQQVAFKETLKTSCSITGVFDKVLGEQELYAEVDFKLDPVPRLEEGLEVNLELETNESNIPNSWKKAAEETLKNGLRTGGNWGYPLIYIRGHIKNIRGTPEKTTESAVAGAVLTGLSQAINKGTVLLEPLMSLDIISPEETLGEITGYLQARRAIIHGIDNLPDTKHLSCEVPLAEMFGFSKALPKLSGGRAAFSMEPCGYQVISAVDLEKMVNRSH